MRSIAAVVSLIILTTCSLNATADDTAARQVDEAFSRFAAKDRPGCAVGVARAGEILLERGYGSANLEFGEPITPATIFEAGSVSKQFTAAALLLLVDAGRLSLDDHVRKFVPELPAEDATITVRQILSHTSGLRDWGTVVNLEGWRRGTRLFTHAHLVALLSRQHELNFVPGTEWSYSNSGYNLAAIIVERVSGQSFPDFTREHIFVPLGMTHSSWRDDYTRVVKGRATAYDPKDETFVSDMDGENVYGNCCLLTTVGDLLRWSENFETKTVGAAGAIEAMQKPARLADGRNLTYGFGLALDPARHVISHSGSTAGYRAYLARHTDSGLSVAILCNRSDAGTGGLEERVETAYGAAPPPTLAGSAASPSPEHVGLFRDPLTDAIIVTFLKDRVIHLGLHEEGPKLTALDKEHYRLGRDTTLWFSRDGVHLIGPHKPEALYRRVPETSPSNAELESYRGMYASEEAGATYVVTVRGGKLVASLEPSRTMRLEPTYADGFVTPGGDLIHFNRDASGHVNGFDVKADFNMGEGTARVERMHFTRTCGALDSRH